MKKRDILLHTCCAPCVCYVYELLVESFHVISYFYNPNISPACEYDKRLDELRRFSELKGFRLIAGEYDQDRWEGIIRNYRHMGERSERCWNCYRMRLEETFKQAENNGIDIITTVLSISPHKDAAMINKIGKDLERNYGIEFMEADFKKRDGYKKSVELSKINGFYRQEYCGCIYSKMERVKP